MGVRAPALLTRSSFRSTLKSLKGLLAYDAATGGTDATRAARRSGEEYLLQRSLFRRLSTGEPVGTWFDRFAYPFRWVCSALNAAEYFRQAALLDGTPPDPQMAEATESSAPQGNPALGCRAVAIPAGYGSRSTHPKVSHRSG